MPASRAIICISTTPRITLGRFQPPPFLFPQYVLAKVITEAPSRMRGQVEALPLIDAHGEEWHARMQGVIVRNHDEDLPGRIQLLDGPVRAEGSGIVGKHPRAWLQEGMVGRVVWVDREQKLARTYAHWVGEA